jgi:CHASE2 domain-containing sensor protein
LSFGIPLEANFVSQILYGFVKSKPHDDFWRVTHLCLYFFYKGAIAIEP